MKKILLISITVSLLACKKEYVPEVLNYDFKIVRTIFYDSENIQNYNLRDSCIYYYDKDKKLLAIEDYNRESVKYSKGEIISKYGKFILDSTLRVTEMWNGTMNSNFVKNFVYNKFGFLDENSECSEEIFQEEGLIEKTYLDIENPDGTRCNQTEIYKHSDTLVPFFQINQYGLFEMPGKHKYLVNEMKSYYCSSLIFHYTHKYQISATILVDTSFFRDPFQNKITEVEIFKYELIRDK